MNAAFLLAAGFFAARPAAAGLDGKAYGVLVLSEGAGSRTVSDNGSDPWSQTAQALLKAFGMEIPVAFAQGDADAANLQRAVDALQDQRVRQIVAVPLFLSSQSPVMDETRFLLGLREKPSEAFLDAPFAAIGAPPRRLAIKTPLTLAKALDDSGALVDVLAARGKALTASPQDDTLVLVGVPPSSKDDAVAWAGVMSTLARKAAARAGFARARALALQSDSSEDTRDRSEADIRKTLRDLRSQGGVCVVLTELAPGQAALQLEDLLQSAFVRYDVKPLLPDSRLVQWVRQSAQDASKLPDMRLFKRRGTSLEPAPPLTFEHQLSLGSQGGTQ